jgi:hypothetical protein
MKKLLNAVAMAGALVCASQAGAATLITNWGYTVTADWVPGSTQFVDGGMGSGGTQVNTPSLISWGAATGNHTTPTSDPLQNRSALGITNSPKSGFIDTNGLAQLGSTITHFNNPISNTYAALDKTRLSTTLKLTQNTPSGGLVIEPPPLAFNVDFVETPNSGTCQGPSVTTCDDIFVISLPSLTQGFDWDGYRYTVNIFDVAGALRTLDPLQCAAAGVAAGCFGLTTPENASTPIQFAFNITANLIPEPAGIALFAAALFAMGATLRRKSS